MSVLVMGLCFKATFGDPMLKAVAVALADHASDDGMRIWPSIATLADKTEIGHRTVQYKLRDLEAAGLIVCVDEGGKGAKDTREYKFDLNKLQALANGDLKLSKGAANAPSEGAPDAPISEARVHLTTNKGASDDIKGARGAPEPSTNHKEPSRASARASEGARAPAPRKAGGPLPVFAITPADSSWSAWVEWLTDRDRRDVVRAAEEARQMDTHSRWPTKDSTMPRVDGRAAIEKRKTGEAA